MSDPSGERDERDWWDRIGEMRWQHAVLLLGAVAREEVP